MILSDRARKQLDQGLKQLSLLNASPIEERGEILREPHQEACQASKASLDESASQSPSTVICGELRCISLSSGSGGNSTYITDGKTGILIDAGYSGSRIKEDLEKYIPDARIDGILITHEHSDHTMGIRGLKGHSFYGTAGTYRGLRVKPERYTEIETGNRFPIGTLTIHPITVPHDSLEPCQYRIETSKGSVGVFTDFGKPTHLIASEISKCDLLLLEFNHDTELLMGSRYPYPLRQRIRGSHGHLSNDQAVTLLEMSIALGAKPKGMILGHLSHTNNTPEMAYRAAYSVFGDRIPMHVGNVRKVIEIAC